MIWKAELELLQCTVEPCGSRVTCDPIPPNADYDFLVEVPPFVKPDFLGLGFFREGSEQYEGQEASAFASFRSGDINLIVTYDPDFAKRHRAATNICKRLNLLAKPDRIAVFQAVLYGEAS